MLKRCLGVIATIVIIASINSDWPGGSREIVGGKRPRPAAGSTIRLLASIVDLWDSFGVFTRDWGTCMKNPMNGKSRLIRPALYPALLAACLFASQAWAATLPPAARVEISSLLLRLAASGCQFKRNGAWHTADEAKAHLQRKLDYLVDRGAVASAEQFIERAATKSSVSGEPYLVKCGSNPAMPSGKWLYSELQSLRAAHAPAAPPR